MNGEEQEKRLFTPNLLRLLAFPVLLFSSFSSDITSYSLRWKDLLDSLLSIGQALSGVLSVKMLRFHLNLKQTSRLRKRGSRVFRETEKRVIFKIFSEVFIPKAGWGKTWRMVQSVCKQLTAYEIWTGMIITFDSNYWSHTLKIFSQKKIFFLNLMDQDI